MTWYVKDCALSFGLIEDKN